MMRAKRLRAAQEYRSVSANVQCAMCTIILPVRRLICTINPLREMREGSLIDRLHRVVAVAVREWAWRESQPKKSENAAQPTSIVGRVLYLA